MAGIVAPSVTRVLPNFVIPQLILQQNQASGAFATLPTGRPATNLPEDAFFIYARVAEVRTRETVSQTAGNVMNSSEVTFREIMTPTYMIRTNSNYDMHDTAAAARWGTALPEVLRRANRQGTFQQMRNFLLYGNNPTNGEGLLNAADVTLVNLPPDPFGNTTISTYDNGAAAQYLAIIVQSIKTRMNQMGLAARITICGPQRDLGLWEYNIVQLVQAQREGAGTMSTAGTVKAILEMNRDAFEWVYDDTLIGKGAGGTDAIIVTIPEIKVPEGGEINTNYFAGLEPGLDACSIMMCDMPAPREIISPLAGGATDCVTELRTSSGWPIRPEATTVISATFQ